MITTYSYGSKAQLLGSLKGMNLQLLSFLLETEDDFRQFMEHFWKGKEKAFFSIMQYRRYKQSTYPVTLDTFKLLYETRPLLALEILFQHAVEQRELNLLMKRMNEGFVTMDSLYSDHKKYPEWQLAAFIL